jgi:hypothetical protein
VPIYCYRIEDTALRDRFECLFDLSLPVSANAAIIADKLYARPRSNSGVEVELPAAVGDAPGGSGSTVTAHANPVPTGSSSAAAVSPDASEMDNSPGGGGAPRRPGDAVQAGDAILARRGSGPGGDAVLGHRFPDAVLYRLAPTGMSEECDESMKRSIKSHSTFIISPDGDASLYAIPDLGGAWLRVVCTPCAVVVVALDVCRLAVAGRFFLLFFLWFCEPPLCRAAAVRRWSPTCFDGALMRCVGL